ncbi:hypothetical protein GE21DRAFT_1085524 [Neurospora crassa]|nr:hypothetical protein GE21DRAFT_1085524 [Neurospora crassa]
MSRTAQRSCFWELERGRGGRSLSFFFFFCFFFFFFYLLSTSKELIPVEVWHSHEQPHSSQTPDLDLSWILRATDEHSVWGY